MLEHVDQNSGVDVRPLADQVAPTEVVNPLQLVPDSAVHNDASGKNAQECEQTLIE